MTQSTNPFDDDYVAPPGSSDDKNNDNDNNGGDSLTDELDALNIDEDFGLWQSFHRRPSISKSRNNSLDKDRDVSWLEDDENPNGENDDEQQLISAGMKKITSRQDEAEIKILLEPLQEEGEDDSEHTDGEILTNQERKDLRMWGRRLEREEVFSHHYTPLPKEHQELVDLATFLGVPYKKQKTCQDSIFSALGAEVVSTNPLDTLFSDSEPHSILLKRGPVLQDGRDHELILLTHGFVLAQVTPTPDDSSSKFTLTNLTSTVKQMITRTFEMCNVYTNVQCIRDTSTMEQHKFAIDIIPQGGISGAVAAEAAKKAARHHNHTKRSSTSVKVMEFQCATLSHQRAWLEGLEKAMVQTYVQHRIPNRQWGWQHQILQTSLHSAAFLGNVKMLQHFLSVSTHDVNELDVYHELSALHYATKGNHLQCMELLLEDGANENVKDGENLTPMYYAEREELEDAMELLQSFGAPKSGQAESEMRGELFKEAQAVELTRKERREQKKAEAKAQKEAKAQAKADAKAKAANDKVQGVQNQMSENMNAMRERGEKLEHLAGQTANLENEAATFADLAKQLKEKTKKQSRWGF